MSSKIKQMSMMEIIKRIGFPSDLSEFESTYRYNINQEEIEKFKNQIVKLNNTPKKGFEDYMKLISEHESIFDKEIYFLHITKLLEKDLYLGNEEKPRVFNLKTHDTNANMASRRQSLYNGARKLLSTIDVVDISKTENDDGQIEYAITCSQEITSQKSEIEEKRQKVQNQLEKIENMIGLKKVLSFLRPRDLIDVCKYRNLGIFLNNYLLENFDDYINDITEELPEYTDEDLEKFKKIIIKNAQYIDLDQMLILSNAIYFNKYGEEFELFDYDEAIDLKNYTERVDFLLDRKKTTVNSKRFEGKIDFKTVKQSVISLYNCYIDGRFYTEEEINDLAQRILEGETSVSFLTKEEFLNGMNFSPEEMKILIENNSSAIEYLINNELITLEEIKELIETTNRIDANQLFAIFSTGMISNDDIVELYMNGKIQLNDIKKIKESDNKNILEDLVNPKKLIELYLSKQQNKEDNSFERYRKLYKLLIIDGKSIKERQKKDDELLDYSLDLLEEDKLKEFYGMGILLIDTVIGCIGEKSLIEFYSNGKLKPEDARRLYDTKIISEKEIISVLKDEKITETEKLTLIFSTFPKEEDEEIRNRLISNLSDVVQSIYNKNVKKSNNINKNMVDKEDDDKKQKINKMVTDPSARWNLMTKIDKDYTQQYLSDGHIIFYLPNREKYIIEKMFTKDFKIAHGAATYIIAEEDFEKNEHLIISQTGRINRTVLTTMGKQTKTTDKIVHAGWSNAIITYFDLNNEEKYTKEQIAELDRCAQMVEKSKRPLERE